MQELKQVELEDGSTVSMTSVQVNLRDAQADHKKIYPAHCHIICQMLHLNPSLRPTCEGILRYVKEECSNTNQKLENRFLAQSAADLAALNQQELTDTSEMPVPAIPELDACKYYMTDTVICDVYAGNMLPYLCLVHFASCIRVHVHACLKLNRWISFRLRCCHTAVGCPNIHVHFCSCIWFRCGILFVANSSSAVTGPTGLPHSIFSGDRRLYVDRRGEPQASTGGSHHTTTGMRI